MGKFRFRKDEHKVLGAGGYHIDHDDIGSLHYTGLYSGNEIVALLVSEWSEDSAERMFALGDFIVRACNSHDQLVAALREAIEIIQAIDQTDNTCSARIDVSDFRAALTAAGVA